MYAIKSQHDNIGGCRRLVSLLPCVPLYIGALEAAVNGPARNFSPTARASLIEAFIFRGETRIRDFKMQITSSKKDMYTEFKA